MGVGDGFAVEDPGADGARPDAAAALDRAVEGRDAIRFQAGERGVADDRRQDGLEGRVVRGEELAVDKFEDVPDAVHDGRRVAAKSADVKARRSP